MKNIEIKQSCYLVFFVIIFDQITKILVASFMTYGNDGSIKIIGDLFKLTYILNPGMAFGIQLGFKYDKVILTIFRIILSYFIAKHIKHVINRNNNGKYNIYIIGLSLILGGAIGNTIDCILYPFIFENNLPINAPFTLFYGQVVDFLNLTVFSGYLPKVLPFIGGKYINLFPIGNIADIMIIIGGVLFLLKPYKET